MIDIFLPYHRELLLQLNEAEVRYLIIGGYAVVIYGYNRGTADMDIWLEPTNDNKWRFIASLKELGFSEASINQLNEIDFEGEVKVFNAGVEPNKIDFLTRVQGLSFTEAYSKRKILPLGNTKVPVVHYEHLITIKLIAGRPKDLADIDELAKINRTNEHE